MRKAISEAKAVRIGMLTVNGPVLFLIIGPASLAEVLAPSLGTGIIVLIFAGGWILAWMWWSVSVPRWRLWAYERVESIAELKRLSVERGLTWPDGHFFGRTEIKSKAHLAREKALEREKP